MSHCLHLCRFVLQVVYVHVPSWIHRSGDAALDEKAGNGKLELRSGVEAPKAAEDAEIHTSLKFDLERK